MAGHVTVLTGPAGAGKTRCALAEYRAALAGAPPYSTLWIAPNRRSAAAVRAALLDESLPACLAPGIFTFAGFAEQIIQGPGYPPRDAARGGATEARLLEEAGLFAPGIRPFSDVMKRVLLERIVRRMHEAGELEHFDAVADTRGFIDLLASWIAELKRAEVWPEQFRKHSKPTRKNAELAAIYERYQAVLIELGMYDRQGRFWWAPRVFAQTRRGVAPRSADSPPGEGPAPRTNIRDFRLSVVGGFSDFTPPQYDILRTLATRSDRVLITLTYEDDPERAELFARPAETLKRLQSELAAEVVALNSRERAAEGSRQEAAAVPLPSALRASLATPIPSGLGHVERELFRDPRCKRRAAEASGITVLGASGELAEVRMIAGRVKRLLLCGVPADNIVVAFRTLDDYAPLVREVFGEYGIPTALEAGVPLAKCPALAALVSLLKLAIEDWPFRRLSAVLRSNYFRPAWPESEEGQAVAATVRTLRLLGIPAGREGMLRAVARLAAQRGDDEQSVESEQRDPGARRRQRDAEAAERARLLLLRLASCLDLLPKRATWAGWAAALERLVQEIGFEPAIHATADRELAERDAAALHRLRHVLAEPAALELETRLAKCLASETMVEGASGRIQKARQFEAGQGALSSAGVQDRRPSPSQSQWRARSARERSRRDAASTPACEQLSLRDFLHALEELLGWEQIPGPADETGRVRVVSAAQVRGLRVPHVFLGGLAERSFPLLHGDSALASDQERCEMIAAGLPLTHRRAAVEEEMLLFYQTVTRATERLTLSYPALDAKGQALLPSPYLEEIESLFEEGAIEREIAQDLDPVPPAADALSPERVRIFAAGRALAGDATVLAACLRHPALAAAACTVKAAFAMIAERSRRDFGRYDGLLGHPAALARIAARLPSETPFSPYALEAYGLCPFRFFMQSVLDVEPLDEPEIADDFAGRGSAAHRVLARLHRRIVEESGPSARLGDLEPARARRMVREVVEQVFPPPPAGDDLAAALAEIDFDTLIEWAEMYLEQHAHYEGRWRDLDEPMRPALLEVAFGSEHPPADADDRSTTEHLVLRHSDLEVRISGRIDRVDLGRVGRIPVFVVIDYKTGSARNLSANDIRNLNALQLLLYALAVERLLLSEGAAGAPLRCAPATGPLPLATTALPLAVGYWCLREKGFLDRTVFLMHECRDGLVVPRREWVELREKLVQYVVSIAAAVRAGRFPVASRDDACTTRCPYATACRIDQVRALEKPWQLPIVN